MNKTHINLLIVFPRTQEQGIWRSQSSSQHPGVLVREVTVSITRARQRSGRLRFDVYQALRPLAPGVYLVVMRPGRESRAFPEELFHPRRQHRMRKIPIPRLELRAGGGRTGNLAAFRIDLDKSRNLVPQGLNHRRAVGFVLSPSLHDQRESRRSGRIIIRAATVVQSPGPTVTVTGAEVAELYVTSPLYVAVTV
jgi:hypothetical protein